MPATTSLKGGAGTCLDDSKESRIGLTTAGRKRPEIASNIRQTDSQSKRKADKNRRSLRVLSKNSIQNVLLQQVIEWSSLHDAHRLQLLDLVIRITKSLTKVTFS